MKETVKPLHTLPFVVAWSSSADSFSIYRQLPTLLSRVLRLQGVGRGGAQSTPYVQGN